MRTLALILIFLVALPVSAATNSASVNRASSQYFSRADSAFVSPTGNSTFVCWVKIDASPSSGEEYTIMAKHDGGGSANGRSFTWSYHNDAGVTKMVWRNSTDGSGGAQTVGSFNYTFPAGWQEIAVVYQTSGTVTMYIGSEGAGGVTSIGTFGSMASSIHDGTVAFTVGARGDPAEYFDGNMSYCRWYNAALAEATLDTDHCAATPSSTNLQAFWSLDNTLTDSSGNGQTLTNNNTATFPADFPSCLAAASAPAGFGDVIFFE